MTRAEIEREFNAPPSRERLERWRAGLLSGDRAPPAGVSLDEVVNVVESMLAKLRAQPGPA